MNEQNDEKLEPILRTLRLTGCPDCATPFTTANVGWSPGGEFGDVFPIVYIACKRCNKRVRVFQVTNPPRSLDDAIQALSEEVR